MKLLLSCISKSWGGMEIYCLKLLKELERNKIDSTFLCLNNSRLHHEAVKQHIKCITISSTNNLNPNNYLPILKDIKAEKYDVIHAQASKDLWFIVPSLIFLRSKIPLFFTKSMQSYIIKKDYLHRKIYKRISHAFALSSAVKENLIYSTPLKDDEISIMPDGVDLSEFKIDNELRSDFRKEFDIEEDEIVIGMASRITYGKGQEELINAAEILNKKFSKLKFVLAGGASFGEEEYEQTILQMVKDKKLENFIFPGFYDSKKAMNGMDIFTFPSHGEALGISLIEALSIGKPCVASNDGGVLDIIEDRSNGLLFKNKDANDLAAKIEILLTDTELRNKIAASAPASVKKFDIVGLAKKSIEIYKNFSRI